MVGLRSRGISFFLGATFLSSGFGIGAALAQQGTQLPTVDVQGVTGGDNGYQATRTATATKTDTPLRDVPQSVTVVTKEQAQDLGAQKLEDIAHYVPGVNWHQGENNRDQIVIRGQSSTADFFVNGMRDDGQLYRDLYNAERVEFLKGPNAMIFGRGGGGGVLNRVLKEADGATVREVTLQGGSFGNKRVSTDVGGKISDTFAARINAVYENSDTFRDFVNLERYGVNPTFTWTPSAATTIKFSYEYFHDERTADRGIPSQFGRPYFPAAPSTFFGNPELSYSPATSNIFTNVIEHRFDNGIKVKSQTRFADIRRFYQNVYPGSSVDPATNTLTLSAYNNTNNRQNLINQTDWTYKLRTGSMLHNLLVGTEFSHQVSNNARYAGVFNGSNVVSASNPVSYVPITFSGVGGDARNRTNADVAAIYGQDQLEITPWLQLIGGIRFDQFRLDYTNLNTQAPATFGQTFARTDNLVSPRGGVVVKPAENISVYGSYSVSYLPASGDQFNALTVTTVGLEPEKFTNKEVGVKWDIRPDLSFTAARFTLDRENTQVRDNNGNVIAAGASRVEGYEFSLAGHVTKQWQMTAGYANLDAKYLTATTGAGSAPGRHVPFVPVHTYSWWNRYDISDTWGVGAGLISQSEYYTNVDNAVIVPGYTRLDAALYYQINAQTRAQLNIENLTGVHYYPTADSNNNISPGSPRAVKLIVRVKF